MPLQGALITHHHSDHTAGLRALSDHFPEMRSWGPIMESIPGLTDPLDEPCRLNPMDGLTIKVIPTPGHTRGHLSFYAEAQGWLFCGDTLFSGGCGRIFEGNPEQLFSSLQALATLPDSTRVYCAHEYTQSNLRFALTIEPDNQRLIEYAQNVNKCRESNQPTVPSLLGDERAINPFLRCHLPSIREKVSHLMQGSHDQPVDTFAGLRRLKDNF